MKTVGDCCGYATSEYIQTMFGFHAARWTLAMTLMVLLVGPAQAQPSSLWDHLRANEWYLPTEDGATELYVTEIGRGDTVLVLHGGWGAEYSYLVDAVRGLTDEYHFVFYDQRGSLRSPIPDHRADSLISVRKHVQDLETLRQSINAEKLTLMGHSMGGRLALLYLKTYPDRVRGLALLGALPPVSFPITREDTLLSRRNDSLVGEFTDRPAIGKEIAEEGLTGDSLTAKEESFHWKIRYAGQAIYRVDRWRQKEGGRAFYDGESATAASRTVDRSVVKGIRPAIRHAEVPTHVIIGDHDFVDMGAMRWERIERKIPNVHLHVIERAGHNAWIDRPAAFETQLNEALTEILTR